MLVEILNHLDEKYSVNYKINLPVLPEEVEIIKNRTGSPVILQRQNQLFFAEEIVDVKFEDIVDPPKKITKKITPETQIIKFEGPPKKKKKTKKKKAKKKKK